MSFLSDAYKMHLKDTIGYEGQHRHLWNLDSENLRYNAELLRETNGHHIEIRIRRKIAQELGIPLDAFTGEHGTIDDIALERTALYAARTAERLEREKRSRPWVPLYSEGRNHI